MEADLEAALGSGRGFYGSILLRNWQVSRHVSGCCLIIYLRHFMNNVSYTASTRRVNVN
jgi:hypothetical protein